MLEARKRNLRQKYPPDNLIAKKDGHDFGSSKLQDAINNLKSSDKDVKVVKIYNEALRTKSDTETREFTPNWGEFSGETKEQIIEQNWDVVQAAETKRLAGVAARARNQRQNIHQFYQNLGMADDRPIEPQAAANP